MSLKTDPVKLTAALVKCPSVTPREAGALSVLEGLLSTAGFVCRRVDRGNVSNLLARWGAKAHHRSFGFNGHTDVVPVGDPEAWSHDPFGGEIMDGRLFGRGSADMKSGVAAFAAAAVDFVTETPPDGAIILAITGDEEGEATDGTLALLDYMAEAGEQMTVCLVGEPTCLNVMGEAIKIGRRGSMNVHFVVSGDQGHSAYPYSSANPVSAVAYLIDQLSSHDLDDGSEHFEKSTLSATTIDTGNSASNVIPGETRATINIRFNDRHSSKSLIDWIHVHVDNAQEKFGVRIRFDVKVSGESFLTSPGDLSDLVASSVSDVLGVTPNFSTTGGTSDARFIRKHCPVVEFGLVGKTMHQVDESVSTEHINQLKCVYEKILEKYFA